MKAVGFTVNGLLHCQESMIRKGKRLQLTREHLLSPTYAQDTSLKVTVKDPVPKLEVDGTALPSRLLAGETILSHIIVNNITSQQIANIRVMSSHSNFLLPLENSSGEHMLSLFLCRRAADMLV